MRRRTGIILTLVLTEACYLYLIYQAVYQIIATGYILPAWSFPAITIWLAMTNLALQKRNFRHITLIVVNLAAFIAVLALVMDLGLQPGNALNYFFACWLWYRSASLSWRKKGDPYSRFDGNLAMLFLSCFLTDLAGLTNTRTPVWLMFGFLCNIAALSLSHGREGGLKKQLAWGIAAAAAVAFLPVTVISGYLLPALVQPAQYISALAQPFLNFLGRLLTSVIIALMKLMNLTFTADPVPPIMIDTGYIQDLGGTTGNPGVLDSLLYYVMLAMVGLLVVLAAAFVFYFLGLFFSRLWRRRLSVPGDKETNPTGFSWLSSLAALYRHCKMRIYILLLPWMSGGLEAAWAYRALLEWGRCKKYPREEAETPYEYLSRLGRQFPGQYRELDVITEQYVYYQFAGGSLMACPSGNLGRALQKLYYPRLVNQTMD